MKTIELSLARIGNSRGIRLPADLIRKHALEPGIILEDRGHELVLRPKGGRRKLSWEETAREMAASAEDWHAWDDTLADGLDSIPWDHPAPAPVAAPAAKPAARSRTARK
ncbi:MAG: AbrB/MazE/SpoVT family DNA-binding domain-containing protein [Verrucomicrobia bacterium]|nr:AbrB/MazE/SpoVT family DNA-binding domain-containing protein [Verrucomicrobiota bacterium]